jgi:hypothetical protein
MNERIVGRHIFDLLYANPQLFPHTHRKRPDGSIVAEYSVVIGPKSPVITLTVTIAPDGTHHVTTTVNGSP